MTARKPSRKAATLDEHVTKPQRFALLCIVTYEIAKYPRTKQAQHLAAIRNHTEVQITSANLRNFVKTAAEKGAGAIFDYFKHLTANDEYFKDAPAHVRKAITLAYGFRPGKGPLAGALINVFKQIADAGANNNESISRAYDGVWNVFRYSGHEVPSDRERPDPYVTRAALRIFPRDAEREDSLAQFLIHYRPKADTDYHTVEGSIISIGRGQHMLFVGWEHDSSYPLDILAGQRAHREGSPPINEFTGLVKRRHEHGHIMVARARFIRAPNGTTFEDLVQKIGMFTQSELVAQLAKDYPDLKSDELFETITNRIANKGKASLRL
jgi:hypothetical protein